MKKRLEDALWQFEAFVLDWIEIILLIAFLVLVGLLVLGPLFLPESVYSMFGDTRLVDLGILLALAIVVFRNYRS